MSHHYHYHVNTSTVTANFAAATAVGAFQTPAFVGSTEEPRTRIRPSRNAEGICAAQGHHNPGCVPAPLGGEGGDRCDRETIQEATRADQAAVEGSQVSESCRLVGYAHNVSVP